MSTHTPRGLVVVAGRHGATGDIAAAPARRRRRSSGPEPARKSAIRHADVRRIRRDRDAVRRWGGEFVGLIAEIGEPTTVGT